MGLSLFCADKQKRLSLPSGIDSLLSICYNDGAVPCTVGDAPGFHRVVVRRPRRREEVKPVSKLLISVVGIVVAIIIAKQFIKDVQNEVAAHDDCSTMSDNDNGNR